MRKGPLLLSITALAVVAACDGSNVRRSTFSTPIGGEYRVLSEKDRADLERSRLFGPLSFTIGGSADGAEAAGEPVDGRLSVNGHLWSAALDVFSKMTISGFGEGGVFATDWYNPEGSDRRYRATVRVTDTRLRSDAVEVTVARQQRAGGEWRSLPPNGALENYLEESILRRARVRYIARRLVE